MPNLMHDEAILTKIAREIQSDWEITGVGWNDDARRGFEKKFIDGLMPDVKRAADAMARINRLLNRIVQDCS